MMKKSVSTPHGRAVPLEPVDYSYDPVGTNCFNPSWESRPSGTARSLVLAGPSNLKFQPLMGEPSLWNVYSNAANLSATMMFQPLMGEPSLWNGSMLVATGVLTVSFNPSWESRPSGTWVQTPIALNISCFNPSWESRPSGTTATATRTPSPTLVSTPHGRAVPLERSNMSKRIFALFCFNPSWESRPSGTGTAPVGLHGCQWFQPLMGEPSLWNEGSCLRFSVSDEFQPLMGEPSLWNSN